MTPEQFKRLYFAATKAEVEKIKHRVQASPLEQKDKEEIIEVLEVCITKIKEK
jgi:hypothetical protein